MNVKSMLKFRVEDPRKDVGTSNDSNVLCRTMASGTLIR